MCSLVFYLTLVQIFLETLIVYKIGHFYSNKIDILVVSFDWFERCVAVVINKSIRYRFRVYFIKGRGYVSVQTHNVFLLCPWKKIISKSWKFFFDKEPHKND